MQTGPSDSFRLGFIREMQKPVSDALRALEANRTEDALHLLERLELDLAAQAKWERQA